MNQPTWPLPDAASSSSDDSLFSSLAPATDPVFPTSNSPIHSNSQIPDSLLSSSSDDDAFSSRPPRRPKTVTGSKTSFILGSKLGEGAYGSVKEGIDENSLRLVAVKILDLRRLRRMRGSIDAVEREVAVQKRLKRHPNLIELIDVIRKPSKSKMYIILELANGCTVQQLAESAGGRLPESQVANLAYQALLAMQYMHGKGVVHRDIKPSNLMLSSTGILKISDFGVAEFLNEYNSDDNVSRTSGSPAFQAPEIANGELGYSGRKVDVWALGVSIYYLIAGKIPFDADNLMSLFKTIGRGEYLEPEWFGESLRDILRRMLTVDWRERENVDELLKHPWILTGASDVSDKMRSEKGWGKIPRRDFGILNVVRQLYNNEEEARVHGGASASASQTSAFSPASDTGAEKDGGSGCAVA